jgi:MFS family permease
LIAVGLLTFFRETKAVKSTEPLMTGIKDIDKYPKFIKIHLLAVFLMIIYLMVPTQIPFILLEYSELNSRNAGIFLAVWILFSSLASFAYSKIRKLLDYYKSFSLAFIFWSLGFLMIFWADNYIVVLIALIIAGIGNGIAIPNIKAQMLDYAGEKQRAKQSGLLSMSLYIGQFLSPVLVEPIIQASTPRIPFLIFSLIMLILILVFYKQSKK